MLREKNGFSEWQFFFFTKFFVSTYNNVTLLSIIRILASAYIALLLLSIPFIIINILL